MEKHASIQAVLRCEMHLVKLSLKKGFQNSLISTSVENALVSIKPT